VELVRKALLVSADCADASVFLAEVTAGTLQEAIDFYRQGVEAGERALGKKASETKTCLITSSAGRSCLSTDWL